MRSTTISHMDIYLLANERLRADASRIFDNPHLGSLNRAQAGSVVVADRDEAIRQKAEKYPLLQWVALIQNDELPLINDWLHLPITGGVVAPSYKQWSSIQPKLTKRHRQLQQWQKRNSELLNLITKLTDTEFDVLWGSLTFDVAHDLANQMQSSPRTIEAHRYNMAKKLNLGSFRDVISSFRVLATDGQTLGLSVPSIVQGYRR